MQPNIYNNLYDQSFEIILINGNFYLSDEVLVHLMGHLTMLEQPPVQVLSLDTLLFPNHDTQVHPLIEQVTESETVTRVVSSGFINFINSLNFWEMHPTMQNFIRNTRVNVIHADHMSITGAVFTNVVTCLSAHYLGLDSIIHHTHNFFFSDSSRSSSDQPYIPPINHGQGAIV